MIEYSGGITLWVLITLSYIATRLLTQFTFYNMSCLGKSQM